MPEFRFVVFHRPGPAWNPGLPPFEQAGIAAHRDHYRAGFAQGLLALGGPFMDGGAGGMMIGQAGVTQAQMRRHAEDDPCVRSGLLVFEVRPWMPVYDAAAPAGRA